MNDPYTIKNENGQEPNQKSKIWPQLLAVLFGSLACLSLGFHFAWSSPALPIILSEDYPLNVTSDEASYITIIQPIGNLFGAPIAGILSEFIGRKTGILLIALPTFISWMFIAFAENITMLYIGRFLSGIGDGFQFIVYPMYVGEITEPRLRGILGCSLTVSLILGMICINALAPFLTIRDSALISSIIPVIFVITFIWMPESPYYLLMKGKIEEARKSLYLLRRCNVEDELQLIQNDVKRQMSEKGTFKDLFCIESNRKALFIMLGIRAAQLFSGIAAFSLFTQTIFIQAGVQSPLVSSIIYLITQLIMTSSGSFLLEKYGRKPLLIISSICTGVVLNIGGIYFYLKEISDYEMTSVNWIPVAVMLCYIISFSVGLGTVPTLLLSEMFSASIKGKALCIMCMFYASMTSTTTELFYFLSETCGMYISFFTFGCACLLSVIFSAYFVPETKGKTLEEIQQYLKGNYSNKSSNKTLYTTLALR